MVPLVLFALWPRLRRNAEIQHLKDELREAGQEIERLEEQLRSAEQERDELKKGVATRSSALPATLKEWAKNTPLTLGKSFRNPQIPLEGNCTLETSPSSTRERSLLRLRILALKAPTGCMGLLRSYKC